MNKVIVEKDWITKTGLRAAIVLNDRNDPHFYCGYVGVGYCSPLYDVYYNSKFMSNIINIHGGLTYSTDKKQQYEVIMHDAPAYPIVDDKETWWFGFDCGHLDDNMEICDLSYVEGECESLAKQLENLANKLSALS